MLAGSGEHGDPGSRLGDYGVAWLPGNGTWRGEGMEGGSHRCDSVVCGEVSLSSFFIQLFDT